MPTIAERVASLEALREGDRRDIERHESSHRWLWRTVVGILLAALGQAIIANLPFGAL